MLAARARPVGLFVIALLASSSGCSGASAPEIPAVVSESSAAEPSPGDAEEEVTESTPSHAPATSSSAPPSDAGEPPPPPPPPCAVEVEPNDTTSHATPFTACFGGKLASSRDRDYFSVVAPPKARKMIIEHEEAGGKVLYRVGRGDGDSVDFDESFTGDAPVIPVKPGATYVFRLTFAPGGSKAARPYELAVAFE